MGRMLGAIVILTAIMLPSAVSAYEPGKNGFSGMDFLQGCANPPVGSSLDGWCKGFVLGVVAGVASEHQMNVSGKKLCGSGPSSYEQIQLILQKYLNDHPERLNEQVSTLVLEAFLRAYSC